MTIIFTKKEMSYISSGESGRYVRNDAPEKFKEKIRNINQKYKKLYGENFLTVE